MIAVVQSILFVWFLVWFIRSINAIKAELHETKQHHLHVVHLVSNQFDAKFEETNSHLYDVYDEVFDLRECAERIEHLIRRAAPEEEVLDH